MGSFLRRLLVLVRRPRLERDLEDELAFHLAMREEEHVRLGAHRAQARAATRRGFGNVCWIKEQSRDAWALSELESLAQDVVYGVRTLCRNPGFALAVIVTIAAGIGASTAMFTLVNGLLLRPLPVREPERLVRVASIDQTGRAGYLPLSVVELIEREQIFDGLCAFLTPLAPVRMNDRLTEVSGIAWSGACFETLGVRPSIGRLFGPEDARDGAPGVVVLSYDTWRSEFAGRPDALGQVVVVEGKPLTVVGVTEPRFTGLLVGYPASLLYPIQLSLPGAQPWVHNANVFARMPPQRSVAQITERLNVLWPSLLEATVPIGYDGRQRAGYLARRLAVLPAATGIDYSLRGRFERPLTALLAISTLVLLVSTVSGANLLMARGLTRHHETIVRLALGAGPCRLVRKALVESAVLLAAALVLGVAVAHAGAEYLHSVYATSNATFGLDLTPDVRTLGFGLGTTVMTLLCFAIGPVWQLARTQPAHVLNRTSTRLIATQPRVRQMLAAAQIAVTLVLVGTASLFAISLLEFGRAPLGFDTNRLLQTRLSPLPGGYDPPFSSEPYYRDLLARLRASPGVRSVSLSSAAPLVTVAGLPLDLVGLAGSDRTDVQARTLRVTEGFFATLGIPLVAGHDFERGDTGRTTVISQSLARRLFGGVSAVGRRLRVGDRPIDQAVEIIGVSSDAALALPGVEDNLFVFLDYWQEPQQRQQHPSLLVRTEANPTSHVARALRDLVEESGHEYIARIQTMNDSRDASLVQHRLLAALSGTFGGLSLFLATLGLSGLLNFQVVRGAREIGIRMALGAGHWRMRWLVLREALAALGMGAALGVPLLFLCGRAVSTLLHGVGPLDPRVVAVTIAVFAVAGILAIWLPARRVTAIDPIVALRCE